MIEIDGSLGEGGGQILRTSLALAAVLEREVRIFNIRAGRSEPGLKAQHLASARAIAQICNASSRGLEIGSTEFSFKPGRPRLGSFRFDVGTAGSITLVLQTLMPLVPFASGRLGIEVHGGTDVKWSPSIDYLRQIVIPILEMMGLDASVEVSLRGHYPKGGGLVRLNSNPSGRLQPITGIERGKLSSISGISHAVKLPIHVAERQEASARRVLEGRDLPLREINIEFSENGSHMGPGCGIVLWANADNGSILGADSLGERGRPAEEVGEDAARRLVEEIETRRFLDRHMGDIIVPFLTLADGVSDVSVSQITQHTLTNVRVAELLAGVDFEPLADLGRPGRLRVKGVGWKREQSVVSPRESGPILYP